VDESAKKKISQIGWGGGMLWVCFDRESEVLVYIYRRFIVK